MKRVFFFVEGDDDGRFIEHIVMPLLEDMGYIVYKPYTYAQETPKNVRECY